MFTDGVDIIDSLDDDSQSTKPSFLGSQGSQVYEAALYHHHHPLHFTFHGWASQTRDNIKSIYMRPRSKYVVASVNHSTKQDTVFSRRQCLMRTPELLVDGYISQTFRPNSAEDYLHHLLKTEQSGLSLNQLCQTLLNPDGSGIFVIRMIPDKISPAPFMQDLNGHPLWLLDYSVVRTGTVIPQMRWSPENVNDYRQHVTEATLQMPIYFLQQNGVLGLSLEDANNGRCQTLRDSRAQAQLGGKTTTHIRIGWPGYNEFRRQVQIRDETSARNPITVAKFAHHIGRSVEAFLRNPTPSQTRRAEFDRWAIGQGGINLINIRIIGAIHVSAGSWMPILQLNGVWIF